MVIYVCMLLCCHVLSGLAGCCSFLPSPPVNAVAVVCRTLFNITDTTNSLVEPHFKATRWVIGKSLKVNTANWLTFPLKYKVFNKYNISTTKRTLNCHVWVNKINNNILLLIKRQKTKKKSIQVKVRSEKVFLYLGGASTKISVSRMRFLFNIC